MLSYTPIENAPTKNPDKSNIQKTDDEMNSIMTDMWNYIFDAWRYQFKVKYEITRVMLKKC